MTMQTLKLLDENGWGFAVAGWRRDESMAGDPVVMNTESWDGDKSAGDYYAMGHEANEFYDEWGVDAALAKLLEANGLYAEWLNAAEFGIYEG